MLKQSNTINEQWGTYGQYNTMQYNPIHENVITQSDNTMDNTIHYREWTIKDNATQTCIPIMYMSLCAHTRSNIENKLHWLGKVTKFKSEAHNMLKHMTHEQHIIYIYMNMF